MDVNNTDPGAGEAVQRIQHSLNRIDTRAEAHKAALENPDVLTGMLEQLSANARLDTQNSETYKKLAAQENVTGVLSEAVHAMTAIAIATSAVLKDKHGIQVDRAGYKMLKSLAGHNETLTEEAKALGDPNWSSRGLWDIERALRGVPADENVETATDAEPVAPEPATADEEEAAYDPDGNWLKYMTTEQVEAVEVPVQKKAAAPHPTFEEEWKMPNRGGW